MSSPTSFSFTVESVTADPMDAYGGVIATLRPLIETAGRHRMVRLQTSLPEHLAVLVPGEIVTIAIGDPDGPYYSDSRLVIDLKAQSVRMPKGWVQE